ncbi:piggyBac transposable element-derived protein 4-like isoform X1 [Patiria miniata]|uniref:SEP domain-containing protein n=1 Tax=Patiria miniata TaxID=46514 RepID=A0A913ZMF4_PATMI|nr:piggyBac transposable element-derived protein 4-like isoform X1 [Patiria miniata]
MADEAQKASLIADFAGVTGVDADRAKFYLESSGWQLQIALGSFYDNDGGDDDGVMFHEASDDPNTAGRQQPELVDLFGEEPEPEAAPVAARGTGGRTGSATKPPSRFHTVSDFAKDAEADSDSGEEGQTFYAGGSDHGSGQQVVGPRRKKNNTDNMINDLFKSARDHGAQEVGAGSSTSPDASSGSYVFKGAGYRLGDSENTGPVRPEPGTAGTLPAKESGGTHIVLKLWKNGFSVNDGELRDMKAPQNAAFLNDISQGKIPMELIQGSKGGEVNLDLEDHRDEEYVRPKVKVEPFSGHGNMLGRISSLSTWSKRCSGNNRTRTDDLVSSGSDEFSSDSQSGFSSSGESSDGASPPARKRAATTPAGQQTNITWHSGDCSPRRFDFCGRPGLAVDFDEHSTPMKVFFEYLTDEFFQKVAEQTNKYANDNGIVNVDGHSKMWSDTTPDEIRALVCLVILMGISPKPSLTSYWSRHPMIETPFFSKTMPRDRFLHLLRYLHFNNNDDDDGSDRLFKLRPVIDALTEKFKTVYVPSQDITTGESVWKFQGPQKCRMYKIYKTCQSTGDAAGYTWNFKIYAGEDRGVKSRVVLDLNEDLLDRGYNIYLDRWFSSPAFFLQLRDRRTNACGTVRLNRKHMPADLKDVRLKRGERAFRSSEEGLLALVWRGKKDVQILSTMHSASMELITSKDKDGNVAVKPSCVAEYERGKCGLDLSDQLASCHRCICKSVKWYKKLFLYLVDLCLVNAFLVYKVLGHDTTFTDFRLNLITEVLQEATLPEYTMRSRPHTLPSPNRLTGRHFPMAIPPTAKTLGPCKRCVVCKAKGHRRETRYACDTCDTPLCIDPCFKIYHTRADY